MPQVVTDPVTGVPNTAHPGGPLQILVNNTKWSGERITGVNGGMYTLQVVPGSTPDSNHVNYLSEIPQEGETEVWEIVNLTADAHPMLNAPCAVGVFCPGYGPPLSYGPSTASDGKYGGNPDVGLLGKNGKPLYLLGKATPPNPNEAGW